MHTPIPPSDLRLGIGPFEDPEKFLASGRETIRLAVDIACLRPSHSILDVGCGCGRIALPLMSYLSDEGIYSGFDPDRECIDWCNENIARLDKRFEFSHVDLRSDSYNPSGTESSSTFTFPGDQAFDLTILSSVITHLYPEETENYFRNIARVLKPDGYALVSALIMDEKAHDAVKSGTTIFDFVHRVGDNCWTFDPERPLDGVACDKDWLIECLNSSGLEIELIRQGTWRQIRSYEIQHDWLSIRKTA